MAPEGGTNFQNASKIWLGRATVEPLLVASEGGTNFQNASKIWLGRATEQTLLRSMVTSRRCQTNEGPKQTFGVGRDEFGVGENFQYLHGTKNLSLKSRGFRTCILNTDFGESFYVHSICRCF